MRGHRIMAVGWAAFLSACALEFIVFACVDPSELHPFGQPLALSRQAIYAASFFVFWAISAMCGAIALLLVKPAAELNAASPDTNSDAAREAQHLSRKP